MSGPMTLDTLLAGIAPAPPLPVAGLSLDSRTIGAGDAFVALQGGSHHGLEHAGQAIARGARAVLFDPAERAPPTSQCARCATAWAGSRTGTTARRRRVSRSPA